MLKEYQPLSQEKVINRKAKPCNNKESSFRANLQTKKDSTTIQNVNYNFNIDNTIASKEDILDNRVTRYSYKYDGLGRLVDADGNYSIESSDPTQGGETKTFHRGFDYSNNGNILNKKIFDEVGSITQNWVYSYDNHAVTQIDVQKPNESDNYQINMSYDATGNMVFQENTDKNLVKNILFDSSNRIKQVHDADNNLVGEYSYDDYGFRVRKIAKSSSEVLANDIRAKFTEIIYPSMYYGLERQLTSDKNIINNTHAAVNNIYLNGIKIASISDTGEARYYLTDQVDSVKVVVDKDGATLNKFEYYPYGETWITEGEGNNNPKYNSQELDRETSFYFYNARHYDPEICRFVTADSVIDGEFSASGWNRYMYVGGNPIGYKDPTGHETYDYAKDPEFSKKVDRMHDALFRSSGSSSIDKLPQDQNDETNYDMGDDANTLLGGIALWGTDTKDEKSLAKAKARSKRWANVSRMMSGILMVVAGKTTQKLYYKNNVKRVKTSSYRSKNEYTQKRFIEKAVNSLIDKELINRRDDYAALKGRKFATYIAGYKDGKFAVGSSSNPKGCAEDHIIRQLGKGAQKSKAVGWRRINGKLILKEINVCSRCQLKNKKSEFPKDIKYDLNGVWNKNKE